MRAVILAAGRGRRLGEYTMDRPKCLIEIAGETLLVRQIAALSAAGASSVAVVSGWRGDGFEGRGLTIFHNADWAQSTMVQSLCCAQEWLCCDDVLVSYGDIVYTPDAACQLARVEAPIAITYDPHWQDLWERRFADPFVDAERFRLNADGSVAEIGGRARTPAEATGQYMGLLKLTPWGWAEIERVRGELPGEEAATLDMTGLLSRVAQAGRVPIAAVRTPGPWCEFDHPHDVAVGADIVRKIDALRRISLDREI
ncbi:NTP transferase domain-containing protein [Streptomyces sp. NBC_00554]|uniref:phosphocholine cytidylyltransferase family protein n=1 Tax=Streptomyces sp. NBC_00554 TaxID=2903661 RepID=UPI00352C057C|nr:NTP transferase domain-containing protein [Streptomyces sp. NBC_00554]